MLADERQKGPIVQMIGHGVCPIGILWTSARAKIFRGENQIDLDSLPSEDEFTVPRMG